MGGAPEGTRLTVPTLLLKSQTPVYFGEKLKQYTGCWYVWCYEQLVI